MIKNRLIVDQSKRIEVKIHVGLSKKDEIIADHNKETLLANKSLVTPKEGLLEVKMWFKQPNYGDDLDIANNTIHQRIDDSGPSISIDTIKIRNYRFKQLLTDWNLTDEEDEPLEISDDSINSLHPAFASAALEGLENVLGE